MWYAVLESDEIKTGKLHGMKRFGEKLVFWRDSKGQLTCLYDKCVHRGAALSIGKHLGDRLQCPFHGFEYAPDGRVSMIPANGKSAIVPEYFKVNSYPVEEKNGFIWVYFGEKNSNLHPVPWFENLEPDMTYSTIKDEWPVHYSRVIENQLDCVHVPFVHYNTIGKGNRTLINGPVEKSGNNQIEFWVFSEVDTGQKQKTVSDLALPDETKQHLHFIFPNIWQNYIVKNIRIIAAFVPVDEENSIIYIRFYQNFMKIPVIRKIIHKLSDNYNFKVERQDRRVVITQQPVKSFLKMDEKLISGDLPIITYRKLRNELIEKNMG